MPYPRTLESRVLITRTRALRESSAALQESSALLIRSTRESCAKSEKFVGPLTPRQNPCISPSPSEETSSVLQPLFGDLLGDKPGDDQQPLSAWQR